MGQQDNVSFGEFEKGILSIVGPNRNNVFTANEQGRITQTLNFLPSSKEEIKQYFAKYFGAIEDVQVLIVSGLAIGDDVPNWEDYKKLE